MIIKHVSHDCLQNIILNDNFDLSFANRYNNESGNVYLYLNELK